MTTFADFLPNWLDLAGTLGVLLAGLAAWGTCKGNNEPPVSSPILLQSNAKHDPAEGA